MKKILIFNSFPKKLSKKEKISFFDISIENIKDNKIYELHKKSQNSIVNTLKQLYTLNNGKVYFKFFYFDPLYDFPFFNNDDSVEIERTITEYSLDEKKELKKLILKLSGRELILKKIFEIKNKEELEILIKFQLRTFRTVLIYFRNLHCSLYGRDEYVYEIHGNYKNDEIYKILKNNKLNFYEDYF